MNATLSKVFIQSEEISVTISELTLFQGDGDIHIHTILIRLLNYLPKRSLQNTKGNMQNTLLNVLMDF